MCWLSVSGIAVRSVVPAHGSGSAFLSSSRSLSGSLSLPNISCRKASSEHVIALSSIVC